MEHISPTLYPNVNKLLSLLYATVKSILENQLTGMYLYGSLANGDFDEHSDIDILIVTETIISDAVFRALCTMHESISTLDSPWALQLEVSYIPKDALHRFDPSHNRHPHLDRGPGEKLHITKHDADWIIQRYILRKHGITITGPDPQTLIAPISPSDLRRAVSDILHNWFQQFLDDPDRLKSRGYQSYTVLTLCRMIYTFEHGEIISKPAAAEWAKQNLGREWSGLIDCAWSGRKTPGLDARPEEINGTVDLIRYTSEYLSKLKTVYIQN